jgi:predicted 3-demethylubiquinone-9 3-methyltransferase (glyoxalase superfamily)
MQTITPFLWFDSQAEGDTAKAARVMATMMQMVKLDIRKLKQAAKGK